VNASQRLLGVFPCCLVLVASGVARAEPITYTFAGTVFEVDEALAGAFQLAQTIQGSFTYESTTPGVLYGSENLGFRDYSDAATAFEIAVGQYSAARPLGNNLLQVANNWGAVPVDLFIVSARLDGAQFNGYLPVVLLGLEDAGATAFVDTLLDDVGDLSDWTEVPNHSGMGYMAFSVGGGSPRIVFQITSISRVTPVGLSVRSASVQLPKRATTGTVELWADISAGLPHPGEAVSVSLDGAQLFSEPFSAFFRLGHGQTYILLKKGILAWVDFKEGELYLATPKADLALFDASNGVDVELRIGGATGTENIKMVQQGSRRFAYRRP
jgi:hypothetical protein